MEIKVEGKTSQNKGTPIENEGQPTENEGINGNEGKLCKSVLGCKDG